MALVDGQDVDATLLQLSLSMLPKVAGKQRHSVICTCTTVFSDPASRVAQEDTGGKTVGEQLSSRPGA